MNVKPYDRTRWDRLQASALVLAIALAGSLPTWTIVALIGGLS